MPQVLQVPPAQLLRQVQTPRPANAPAGGETAPDATKGATFADTLQGQTTSTENAVEGPAQASPGPASADGKSPTTVEEVESPVAEGQAVESPESVAPPSEAAPPEPVNQQDVPAAAPEDGHPQKTAAPQPVVTPPALVLEAKPAEPKVAPAAAPVEPRESDVAEPGADAASSAPLPRARAKPASQLPTPVATGTAASSASLSPPQGPPGAQTGEPAELLFGAEVPQIRQAEAPSASPSNGGSDQSRQTTAATPAPQQPVDAPIARQSGPSKRTLAETPFKLVAEPALEQAPPPREVPPAQSGVMPAVTGGVRSATPALKGAGSAPQAQASPSAETTQAVALRGLAAAVQQRGGSVTLRLSPESLGALKIEMSLERGMVAVDLRAATPEAHELLSQSLGTLRSSLEARGLNVERLNVHLSPAPAPQSGSSNGGDQQQPGWREDSRAGTGHDAGGGASRGRDDSNRHHSQGGAPEDAREGELPGALRPAFASTFRLALDAVA